MGLDVIVYKNVKKVKSDEDFDFAAYVIGSAWDHKIKNLETDALYKGEESDKSINYPYSVHNRFREHLLKLQDKNYLLKEDGTIDWYKLDKEPNIPFYEFIDFADNEGCIDWETNEIIYNNFKENESRAVKYAKKHAEEEPYFIERYKSWLNIFKEGKEEGSVVVFT